MKKVTIILILISVFLLQGCMAFMASTVGYQDAMVKYQGPYNDYRVDKAVTNIERQKQGLPPEPVKEFNDWLKAQPLTRNEIKVFKYFGILSAEEAKEMKEALPDKG